MEQIEVYAETPSQFFYIDVVGNMRAEDVSIFNYTGCKVENVTISNETDKLVIDVNNLSKGVYYVVFIERTEGVIKKGKFIVTK
ncbi:MAG: T9SS type A sorting domain-containing protein [Flavobacteriales bacterium]|nr:T9SS type A sorting domain-containing protein [Flavobacteriales bacterium]